MIQVTYGAIAAAAIAGIFSVLTLILSREQKVSEFRRNWLEDIRSELAVFLAHANLFATFYEQSQEETDVADILSGVKTEIVGMNDAASRLRLRLGSSDAIEANLLARVCEIQKLINGFEDITADQMSTLQDQVISDARVLMKSEWKRVKKGETVYRIVKIAAFIALVFALSIALYLFLSQ